MFLLSLFVGAALAVSPDADQSVLNGDGAARVRLYAELGSLLPVSHVIQFDRQGTELDYVRDGGQDNLFRYTRWQADLDIGDRHTVSFLYQPLDLRTEVRLNRRLVVDDEVFARGTPMDLRYGFDFVRSSWMYDLKPEDDRELGLGLSLQIRNATIDFRSADGAQQRSNRNIGPVPILKTRIRQPWGERGFWLFEADGFYAPVSYLNGDDNDVVGAILDTSLRAGLTLNQGVDSWLNLRYIGGGAEGQSDDSRGPGDGYTRNWLHFVSLSLGVGLR